MPRTPNCVSTKAPDARHAMSALPYAGTPADHAYLGVNRARMRRFSDRSRSTREHPGPEG